MMFLSVSCTEGEGRRRISDDNIIWDNTNYSSFLFTINLCDKTFSLHIMGEDKGVKKTLVYQPYDDFDYNVLEDGFSMRFTGVSTLSNLILNDLLIYEADIIIKTNKALGHVLYTITLTGTNPLEYNKDPLNYNKSKYYRLISTDLLKYSCFE